MIQINIVMTGKGYSPKDKFRGMGERTEYFGDMKEAREFIKETYGKCKRVPMYVDTKEGKTKKIGYVFGFHNEDVSHSPVEKWIQQDWVSFNEVKEIEVE